MLRSVPDLQLLRCRLAVDASSSRVDALGDPDDRALIARHAELTALQSAAERDLIEARARGRTGKPEAYLAGELGLGDLELDFVWALVARAVDPQAASAVFDLIGATARRGLSLAQHVTLRRLDETQAQRLARLLSPNHLLRKLGMLVATESGEIDVTMPLTVAPRLAAFLLGDTEPDALLSGLGGTVRLPEGVAWDAIHEASLARIAQALASPDPTLVLLEGPQGSGRRTAAAWAAARLADVLGPRELFAIDAGRIAPSADALEEALGALMRECRLRGAIPLIAEVDELSGAEGDQTRLRMLARTIEASATSVVVTTTMPGFDVGVRERRLARVAWPVPTTQARRALWRRVLGADDERMGSELDTIALRYRLGPGGIREGAASARAIAEAASEPMSPRHLVEGIRNNIAERLGELAQRVTVKQTWDDLVLAPDTMDEVTGLVARVRHAHKVYESWGFAKKMPRGIGVAALFSGPPGTGKTMVAGLLAKELDLELYQVDLSKVVSKWVGETEKQLARIFEAADAGHALLLFDEADSLFAKRTEVKSAIDRYANLEVNYLLQRIETFGGITILTTNLDTSIDPALRRRLASHIVFNAPEHAESVALWARMLDTEAPMLKPLDLTALANSYGDMSGANIRNAVLAAAFLAAAEGSPITQKHLIRAAKGEYRAMGRVLG